MTSYFGWTEWLSMMGSFLVVLALLVVTLIAIKKMGPKIGITTSKRLEVLEVQNLGGRQKIVLMRVNNEQVLVGLSAQQITRLGSFPHAIFESYGDQVEGELAVPSKEETTKGFKQILSRVLTK